MKKSEIADRFIKDTTSSRRGLGAQFDNTKACISFYNGDCMDYKDDIQFRTPTGNKKALVQFNKVKSNVDAVVGFMAQNRREVRYVAKTNSAMADLFSRYKNAIADYVAENTFSAHIETEQDLDMLINGYGATETDMSYILGGSTTDPNGEIIVWKLDPECVGWDFNARQKNLIDAGYVWYYKDYTLKDAVDLFDESEDKFEVATVSDNGGYEYNPYGGAYTKIRESDTVEWAAKQEELVRVYNYQWMQYEDSYRAKNPLYSAVTPEGAMIIQAKLEMIAGEVKRDEYAAGDMFDFDPRSEVLTFDDKIKRRLVEELGDLINPVKFKRKCYYTAICSGRHVFKWFKSISQQGFSVKFKTGTFNAKEKIWVGMVNAMMNPQKYYNKALTELLFTIASNSKGGVMVERGAVEDINDFSSKWAKTDAVIVVNDGAITQGRIQEKARATVPTGLEGIVSLSDASVSDASGIDRSFLGSREAAQESGIMYKRRIRQVVSTMARYMDSISMYQKMQARLMSDYVRVWVQNNDGSLIKITGEDGIDEFIALSYDKMVDEYEVSLQEAPTTPEEKQEKAATIGQFGDRLAMINPAAAQQFYAESIRMMGVDGDIEARLIKALQPQEQEVSVQEFQQLQAIVQQLQSDITQASVRKTLSDAALNEAKAQETAAKTAETLESAANKGLENDLLRAGNYQNINVTI